jgi:signal transduction histidine kinase/CheY-like chemotaxis protein
MLSLVDADGLRLRLVASMGLSPAARTQLADVPVGEGACGLACAARHRVVIEDTEKDARFEAYRVLAKQEGFRAVHSTPLITQQGDVLGAISVHLDTPRGPSERERALADICARKATVFIERARAQAALEEAQGRYRAVLEASAVPFSVLAPVRNEHGAVIDFSWSYLNTAAAQALQGEPGSFVGRRLMQILPPSWRHSEAFANCMAVADGAQTRRFEIHTTHRGADRWFHCIAWPMRGSVAVWFADISERKKTEQLLHEADRRKDEFLATLAHELRNPLAPIRQAALLSKAPNATEAQKRWSHEVIDRQVQHMALLLDDLLDVSRITRGVLSLRKSSAELAAVIDAAIETARPLIDAKRHKLSVDLPSTTVRFEADPLRISQVVANLLANAAKYTDPGGHIRVRAAREDDEIVIDVIDDGIGIPPASLGEVFQMFVQLHHTGDRTGGGLGIGLALTRGLVELHGGRIEAVSDGPGTGSRFTVHLPVGATAGSDVAAPTLPLAAPPVWRKILVADDNRDAADSLALLLELQGHQVVRALDGESALESYRRLQPDICLLDIGMPGRSGYEVARAIRQSPGGDRPVLIAITGWGQEHDRSQAIAAGFDHHMTKPVDPQRLTRLVVADVPYRPQRTAVDETGTAG